MLRKLIFLEKKYLIAIITIIILTWVPTKVIAHSNDEIQGPYGTSPIIDGEISEDEWTDANKVTLNIEGNSADIYFKHNRENLYVGFDINEGHNSVFPDTRVFLDIEHDGADAPQTDDFELYINPDNGDFRERQGDGQGWIDVEIIHWKGAYIENGTDHWSTEYEIQPGKLGNDSENKTLGIAFLIYGNSAVSSTWPNNADIEDPSTWGDIEFLDWEEKKDDELLPSDIPLENNETGTNLTNVDEDSDNWIPGFSTSFTIFGIIVFLLIIKNKKYNNN